MTCSLTTIARVRRMMPRNEDVMSICDAAEAGLIAANSASDIVNNRCVICAGRREANKVQMKAARAKKKPKPKHDIAAQALGADSLLP